MVHEAFGRMISGVVAAPVAVPRLPIPLFRVVPIDPRPVDRLIKAGRVLLEPLPLVVMIRLHEARLVIETPSAVQLAVPLPEPLPEVDVLLGPGDPAEVVRHLVLLVLLGQDLAHSVLKTWSVLAFVERPDSVAVVRITIALQPVVNVARPLVVLALPARLVPVVPVLPPQILFIDVVVAVALLAVPVGVGVVNPVLIVVVGVLVVAVGGIVV